MTNYRAMTAFVVNWLRRRPVLIGSGKCPKLLCESRCVFKPKRKPRL